MVSTLVNYPHWYNYHLSQLVPVADHLDLNYCLRARVRLDGLFSVNLAATDAPDASILPGIITFGDSWRSGLMAKFSTVAKLKPIRFCITVQKPHHSFKSRF